MPERPDPDRHIQIFGLMDRKSPINAHKKEPTMTERHLIDEVREQYADVARGALSNDSNAVRSIATAFGYSEDELRQLPSEANMGLSCGNPLALASLREGEVVVDLGCGGGMDVFLAARKVGVTGRVIGIDMTAEMLERARAGQRKIGLTNVEFHQATIDRLPLPENSVDCVISNCVINLVPDKLAVFREILRVLKPGGRVAISDIGLKQPLPSDVKQSVEAYVGCISGAILIDDYRGLLEQAGFISVVVTNTGADLNSYSVVNDAGCCSSDSSSSDEKTLHAGVALVLKSFDANAYAASLRIHALKQTVRDTVNVVPVLDPKPIPEEKSMRSIQVYDKPMCCSTGICGPDVDATLPKFAADLDWLKSQGHRVERYNLAQQPEAFVANKAIHALLTSAGPECLPIVVVDGNVVSQAVYPSREDLADWTATAPTRDLLPVAKPGGGCCAGGGCC
jgi:arsenite methyltransferase